MYVSGSQRLSVFAVDPKTCVKQLQLLGEVQHVLGRQELLGWLSVPVPVEPEQQARAIRETMMQGDLTQAVSGLGLRCRVCGRLMVTSVRSG